MTIEITLDGNKRVSAHYPDGLSLLTDQPVEDGGDGSAPSPFACFLGAIGTCAGVYVMEFCRARRIPIEGIALSQQMDFETDEQGKRRLAAVNLTIKLPADFPEKYRGAIVKAAGLCSVKKAIMTAPAFNIDYQVA
jgi:ribosomal protein S12 methylthiotransferase accessory factor